MCGCERGGERGKEYKWVWVSERERERGGGKGGKEERTILFKLDEFSLSTVLLQAVMSYTVTPLSSPDTDS